MSIKLKTPAAIFNSLRKKKCLLCRWLKFYLTLHYDKRILRHQEKNTWVLSTIPSLEQPQGGVPATGAAEENFHCCQNLYFISAGSQLLSQALKLWFPHCSCFSDNLTTTHTCFDPAVLFENILVCLQPCLASKSRLSSWSPLCHFQAQCSFSSYSGCAFLWQGSLALLLPGVGKTVHLYSIK